MAQTPWQAVAVLVDPVRRSLFDHVRGQRRPVTREGAAEAVGISRNLTAFHLDKLVEAGLLRARYEAPAGQPRGRGRAPKVYEPVDDGLSLTVPPRHYELIGEILADAVAEQPADARAAATRRAIEVGGEVASASGVAVGAGADIEAEVSAAYSLLLELGFEPAREGDAIELQNCPFHRLAARQTELVCGLNESFIRGLLDGVGVRRLSTRLQPRPGRCCVRINAPRASNDSAAPRQTAGAKLRSEAEK